jgi:hypothetical protein
MHISLRQDQVRDASIVEELQRYPYTKNKTAASTFAFIDRVILGQIYL